MDGLTAFVRLVEALVWPAMMAVVILVLAFRPEFRGLVPLLRKIKAGPLEAEFERTIREISEEAGGATTLEIDQEPDPRKSTLIELARLHPRSAILEAWLGVTNAVRRAALQKAGSPASDVSSPLKAVRELVRAEAITPEDLALFHDLRGLRNQAAHAADFQPSQEAPLEYIDLASQLQARLDRLAEPNL